MNKFKSHFLFTKNQRNGIFLLLELIILFQCAYFFIDFSTEDIQVNSNELQKFQEEIDSLKLVEIENNKPIIYPFNPNYITDYKGY
ncbi:MAG: helix-hairpin-helix domain-containing protein, partial [Gelidibacter sp.]|nr:helix-hairpin-helix domain-containing protein [Gelidibacter sp.]